MKVIFITDFNLNHTSGGAQVSNDLLIEKGRALGHEIIMHNYDGSYEDFSQHYDLLISSNLEAISKITPGKLNFIFNHEKHVRVEHDSCLYLTEDLRERLFSSSKINFFLSEFHISFFRKMYGDIFHNVEIVADPINTSLFREEKLDKIYDIVYCGFLHELKGFYNLIDFSKKNLDRKIDVFGWGHPYFYEEMKKYKNISFHEKVSHLETARIYQKSRGIFHNPIVNEPFCRMVAEAILCGVKEFHGDMSKIGSFQEYERIGLDLFAQNCTNATDIFWQKIEDLK